MTCYSRRVHVSTIIFYFNIFCLFYIHIIKILFTHNKLETVKMEFNVFDMLNPNFTVSSLSYSTFSWVISNSHYNSAYSSFRDLDHYHNNQAQLWVD